MTPNTSDVDNTIDAFIAGKKNVYYLEVGVSKFM